MMLKSAILIVLAIGINVSGTCVGGDSCCTKSSPCLYGEGDCDRDHDCAGAYYCGTDNCDRFNREKSFDGDDDCCKYIP